jgi:hypothetical protein
MTYLDKADYANADADFTRSLTLRPGFQASYFGRALAAFRAGNYSKSIQDNTEAIRPEA